MKPPRTTADHESALTIHVRLSLRKLGGRKLVIAPEQSDPSARPRHRIDSTIVKALARAHRWKRMLEGGHFATLKDLAAAERINPSYLCRVLRLTVLAPDLVERLLDGRQPAMLQLAALLKPLPDDWERQRLAIK
jgi:hypothetical protein